MRLTKIPFERFKAIDHGCRGLARALTKCIQQGDEPDLRVLRVIPENGKPLWSVEVRAGGTHQQFAVDMSMLETKAAVVPIYLVDHVQSIRKELSEVFEIDRLLEGVNWVVPFGQLHGAGKLS